MSFRYQKSINLGKGTGLNISKNGLSVSKRTKYGSISSRGFSLKTNIPGLTYRKNWGKAGGAGLAIMLTLGAAYLVIIVVYNIVSWAYHLMKCTYYRIKS